ncbi:unnamed protein product [Laminaria digitata]
MSPHTMWHGAVAHLLRRTLPFARLTEVGTTCRSDPSGRGIVLYRAVFRQSMCLCVVEVKDVAWQVAPGAGTLTATLTQPG